MSARQQMPGPIDLVVNGESVTSAASTLAGLLESLGYAGLKVATARNGTFVPEKARTETALESGDRIEIVSPRQGG